MRDDLLDAQAAVDWAVAQIQVLTRQLTDWRRSGPYLPIAEPDSESGKEIIKIRLRSPLPRAINAEAGAIINMIRSSLDILAVALAERNGHIGPKDTYFPIGNDATHFMDAKHGALEKIKRLSDADRFTIEQLKPYNGGNDILYSLHELDKMRKHRRLIGLSPRHKSFHIVRWGTHEEPEWLYRGALEDGAPFCRIPAGSGAHIHLTLEVTFNETPFGYRRPVSKALRRFAGEASKVIALFDR